MTLNKLNLLLLLGLVIIATTAFCQVDTTIVEQPAKHVAESGGKVTFLRILIDLVISAGVLFMIGHMLYVLFKSKRFNQTFSIPAFKAIRLEQGKSEMSTEEENDQCLELLNEAFFTWTDIEVNGGEEYRKPRKMKEILTSAIYLQQVVDIAPTDGEVIDKLNEYKEVIRSNEKRSFDGSRALIVLGLIFAVVVGVLSKSQESGFIWSTIRYGAFFWIPVIVYYISSLTPQFLIDKRAQRGGGNVSTGFVALALGILGSGFTMRTRFTDGSYEDDHSGHYIAWILGAIALTIVAITIFFWSIFNYVRNYLLFF